MPLNEREQAAFEAAKKDFMSAITFAGDPFTYAEIAFDRAFTAALAVAAEQREFWQMEAREMHRVSARNDETIQRLTQERALLEHQNKGLLTELYECEQILGKALGYPTEGPEIGGNHTTVCAGEAVGCPRILAQQLVKQRAEDRKVMERCLHAFNGFFIDFYNSYTVENTELIAAIRARLEVKR